MYCEHKQCFDLETFLLSFKYSATSKCPICKLKIEIHSILIDSKMKEILKETNENRICIKENGEFEIIKIENMNKKRKLEKSIEFHDIIDLDDEEDEEIDSFQNKKGDTYNKYNEEDNDIIIIE